MRVPYEDLAQLNQTYAPSYDSLLGEVALRGNYLLGPELEAFESEVAEWIGVDTAIGVASGYDALRLTLEALGLSDGSVVALQDNSYIATVCAVLSVGARVAWFSTDKYSLQADTDALEDLLKVEKVDAILVTHMYGNMCDMTKATALAGEFNIKLIEDCAQAMGSRQDGRHAGSFGVAGCFSCYPTKNLGALADAGFVVTNDILVSNRLKMLRNYGFIQKNNCRIRGHNSRLDELNAGFLRRKLKHLSVANEKRDAIRARYKTNLRHCVTTQDIADNVKSSNHIFPILHPRRDELRSFLSLEGVDTLIHYPVPVYRQDFWRSEYAVNPAPAAISDMIHAEELSLPISPILPMESIDYVIELVNHYGR